MTYLQTHASLAPIDAYILQAPTSDRATAAMLMTPDFYARSLDYSAQQLRLGNGDAIMPRALLPEVFTTPITAYRWHSLIAEGYVCRHNCPQKSPSPALSQLAS